MFVIITNNRVLKRETLLTREDVLQKSHTILSNIMLNGFPN